MVLLGLETANGKKTHFKFYTMKVHSNEIKKNSAKTIATQASACLPLQSVISYQLILPKEGCSIHTTETHENNQITTLETACYQCNQL